MSWQSTTVFYEQLRMLLKSGIPMGQALGLLGDRVAEPYRSWLPDLVALSDAGRPLSEGLRAKGERAFPLAMMAAGERSGHQPELCAQIVAFYEHAISTRNMVIARSVYPLVLMHAATMIPMLVLSILDRAPTWSILVGPAVIWGVIIGCWLSFRLGRAAGLMARLGTLPILRAVVRPLVAANTCLILHAGTVSGMLFAEMLELAADGCGNRTWGERLRRAARDLHHGRLDRLTDALRQAGMPDEVVRLCDTAEEAGELEQAMDRAARLQRERFVERVHWAARIFTGLILALGFLFMIIAIGYLFMTTIGKQYQEAMDFMNEATSVLW